MDGWTFLDDEKIWVVSGWGGLSSVQGTRTRITNLQQSPRHRFQRPDFKYKSVDSISTSLNGYAGRLSLNKQKGDWMLNTAIGLIDPGFDINDLGFMWRTNIINAHFAGGHRWTEPGEYFRGVTILGSLFGSKDFDGNTTWAGFWYNFSLQFLNYYSLEFGGAFNPETVNTDRTRGGPLTKNKSGAEFFIWSNTDSRKDVVLSLNGFTYISSGGSEDYNIELNIQWKPTDNLSLSLNPDFSWNNPFAQWVDAFDDNQAENTYGRRYVYGNMRQKTFSSSLRANWTFSPELSLQVYVQPLISSGDYFNFKYLSRSNSYAFTNFGEDGSTINYDGDAYTADADGDGPAASLSWDDPDFTFTSLRGNAVLRWEYSPGSAFYLVWTQSRSDFENNGHIRFHKPFPDRFLNNQPDNIFLLKLTYWLGI